MAIACENCLKETKYHSSNTDLFGNKKYDIYYSYHCFVGKTIVDKQFNFTSHYPKNNYGHDGKKFNIYLNLLYEN